MKQMFIEHENKKIKNKITIKVFKSMLHAIHSDDQHTKRLTHSYCTNYFTHDQKLLKKYGLSSESDL